LIIIGWGIPTVRGVYINPDVWGGTVGTKSIQFVSLVSIGCLFYFVQLVIVQKRRTKNWVIFFIMLILVILPFSFVLISVLLITIIYLLLVIPSGRKKLMAPLSIFLVFFILFISLPIDKIEVFNRVYIAMNEKLPDYISIGVVNNPKLKSWFEIVEIYLHDPGTILLGVGPGEYISGGKVQADYKGIRADITGGGQLKNTPFVSTFAETGLFGGIIMYVMIFILLRFFLRNYRTTGDPLLFFGYSILLFFLFTSLVQESFEYPLVGLVGASLLGLIYKNFQFNNALQNNHSGIK